MQRLNEFFTVMIGTWLWKQFRKHKAKGKSDEEAKALAEEDARREGKPIPKDWFVNKVY